MMNNPNNNNNKTSENNDQNEDEDDMNYGEIIDHNHLDIVTNLDLDRQFILSYLRSRSVVDEEDCDMIRNTGSTRQQKVSIFLDVIKRKGDEGMQHFVNALEFEHPSLYEKCTGKKATTAMATGPRYDNRTWNWLDGGLAGKEYVDFDRAVLCKQLEQTVSDLHWITRSLHKVQEEKNIVEKQFMEAHNKTQAQDQYIEELKDMIERTSERLTESDNSGHEAFADQAQYLLAAQHDIVQRTNLIIGLQAKLLAQTEEIDQIKKDNFDIRTANESLKKEVYELALICDKEKRTSKRLNEQVMTQHGEIKQVEHYKIHNRELRLKISILEEEKGTLRNELEEFRKCSEVMSAKYSLIIQERSKLKENREEISTSYQSAQEQINDLTAKLANMKCEWEYVLRNNERLRNDVKTYRELQRTLHEEREHLRTECEEAWKGVEKANEETMNSKRYHDEAIHNQMIINFSLDSKYREVIEELDDIRVVLQQTNAELIRTKKLLGISRTSGSFSSSISQDLSSPPPPSDNNETESKQGTEQNTNDQTWFATNQTEQMNERNTTQENQNSKTCDKKTCENETKGEGNNKNPVLKRSPKPIRKKNENRNEKKQESSDKTPGIGTLKRRANKDLLDSIRRKLSEDDSEHTIEPSIKGLFSFQQLEMMYNPNVTRSLPGYYSDQQCLSLPLCFAKRGSRPTTPPTTSSFSAISKTTTTTTATRATSMQDESYRRSVSCDVKVTRRVRSSVGRELSGDDSVFEHPIGSPKPTYTDDISPTRRPTGRHVPQTRKEMFGKDDDRSPSSFRKRSFLIDSKEVSSLLLRRRSTSAPPSPAFNCSNQF